MEDKTKTSGLRLPAQLASIAAKVGAALKRSAEALRGRRAVLLPFAAGSILTIIIIAIVFALPLKTIRSEHTESYYETATMEESYTVTEPYVAEERQQHTAVLVDGYYISSPAGISVPFSVDRTDTALMVAFDNPFTGTFAIVKQPNLVIWQTRGSGGETELALAPGDYLARFRETMMWGQDCYIYVAQQWSETEQVTQYREVTRYREVPVRTEKERTVIEEEKISLWKHIFD